MLSFRLPYLALATTLAAASLGSPEAAAQTPNASIAPHLPMILRITIDHTIFTVALEAGPAARDFAARLPLTLELSDYNRTEKIAQLPRKLSIRGEPAGYTPKAGDLAYYAPWGNIALFYRDFAYSTGLVKLGHLSGDLEVLRQPGPLLALIEQE